MKTRLMTSFFCTMFLCAQILVTAPAHSAMVGTADVLVAEQRTAQESRIMAVFQRESVRNYLTENGVTQQQVESRLQRLTNAEVAELASKTDELPAAAGVLELVVVVFLVLLLLDLLKVTDIFPTI